LTKHVEILCIILLFLLALPGEGLSGQSSISNPYWMRPDSYVQYEFNSQTIIFKNGTVIASRSNANVIWGWQCIKLNQTFANLNISVCYSGGINKTFVTEVHVNLSDRRVYAQNGSLIGTTVFWLPDNPLPDDEIVLWDVFPDRIVSQNIETVYSRTSQGRQKSFSVEGFGKVQNRTTPIRGIYDFDTGILVQGFPEIEPSLLPFGIKIYGVNGGVYISNTNIDLGPSELNVLEFLPFIALIAAIALIILGLVMKRRKRVYRASK
jgi:hypothetical protein